MKRCATCDNSKDHLEALLALQEVYDVERCLKCTFYSEWKAKFPDSGEKADKVSE